jgi:hypothetical protein
MSRAQCSAGITAGGSNTAHLPTASNEANSSCVSFFGAGAIVRAWHRSKITNVQFCSDQMEKGGVRI